MVRHSAPSQSSSNVKPEMKEKLKKKEEKNEKD
jgi:hypothetical protein